MFPVKLWCFERTGKGKRALHLFAKQHPPQDHEVEQCPQLRIWRGHISDRKQTIRALPWWPQCWVIPMVLSSVLHSIPSWNRSGEVTLGNWVRKVYLRQKNTTVVLPDILTLFLGNCRSKTVQNHLEKTNYLGNPAGSIKNLSFCHASNGNISNQTWMQDKSPYIYSHITWYNNIIQDMTVQKKNMK